MPFADWIMAGVFACMALAIVVDQRAARPARPASPPPAGALEAARRSSPADAIADLLRDTDGWAMVGPDGALLATNLQRRAALLAAACAALKLSGEAGGTAGPAARMEANGATLLAQVSGEGLLLAVLLAEGRDEEGIDGAMSAALGLTAAEWLGQGRSAFEVEPAREAVPARRPRPLTG